MNARVDDHRRHDPNIDHPSDPPFRTPLPRIHIPIAAPTPHHVVTPLDEGDERLWNEQSAPSSDITASMRSCGTQQLRDYQRLRKLGEGTYGRVWKAVDRETGATVALKIIHNRQEEEGIAVTTMREIGLLRHVDHPNCQNLLHVLTADRAVVLVTPFIDCDLQSYLRSARFDADCLQSVLFQLLCAVNYLHLHRILHRDIKPSNILLSRDGVVKLTDFGLARRVLCGQHGLTREVSCPAYRPPELLLGTANYSFPADVWSLGCVFVEAVTGRVAFRGQCELDVLQRVCEVAGTPCETTWPGLSALLMDFPFSLPQCSKQPYDVAFGLHDAALCELVERMLIPWPAGRITAREALQMPYFRTVPEQLHANAG